MTFEEGLFAIALARVRRGTKNLPPTSDFEDRAVYAAVFGTTDVATVLVFATSKSVLLHLIRAERALRFLPTPQDLEQQWDKCIDAAGVLAALGGP